MSNELSNRGRQWQEFSEKVLDHIENYTVPQYGDMPNDQAEDFDAKTIGENIGRYKNRIGTNLRGQAEADRDCLKIAHYACLLLDEINK